MQPVSDATTARAEGAAAPDSAAPAAPIPVREYTPTSRRIRVRDIFSTLQVAQVLALRDFQTRYKQSLLGPIWLVIQPLAMVGGFTVIFGSVAEVSTEGIPYVLFSVIGVTVWTTFQMAVLYGTRTIVANKGIVKNLPVPRVALITSTVMGGVPQFAFMVVLCFVAVVATGEGLRLEMLALPLCALWLFVFLYAIIMPLAAWHARYRDVGSTVPFLFQAGLFLSPVAYPISEAPDTLATILSLNPLAGIIESWRWSLVGSDVGTLAFVMAVAWTVALALLGWRTFSRAEVRFADVV